MRIFQIFAELTIQLMALAEIIKLVSHTFLCIFLFGMKFAIPMHIFGTIYWQKISGTSHLKSNLVCNYNIMVSAL